MNLPEDQERAFVYQNDTLAIIEEHVPGGWDGASEAVLVLFCRGMRATGEPEKALSYFTLVREHLGVPAL